METEDIEALGRQRADQARSKPDRVDQLLRTDRTFVHHYNSTQYCKTETIFPIFPFPQTNFTSQMWPCGGQRGDFTQGYNNNNNKQLPVAMH